MPSTRFSSSRRFRWHPAFELCPAPGPACSVTGCSWCGSAG